MAQASLSGQHRPPPMSAQTFKELCGLIHRHSRIHLVPSKLALLTSRLSRRLRELEMASWEDYLTWLEHPSGEEIGTLIDLVSTNHTHFFRESVHFDALSSHLLDELLRNSPTARQGLRCWSAASSSGEEAFTLAMVLSEYAAQKSGGLRWQIQGTDISSLAIEKARQAVYPVERLGFPEPAFLPKYFQKGSGPFEGFCKVKTELQDKVHFQQMNLFDPVHRLPLNQHVVFCRNVLIYFDLQSQTQLVERLHNALEPGGVLMVGHSDCMLRIQHPFKSLGKGIYQRER